MKTLMIATSIALISLSSASFSQTNPNPQPFIPEVPYHPKCTFHGTPQIVPNYTYEDRVYGYVRYCAVEEGEQIRVTLWHYWTNGHLIDGDTVCSSHWWRDAQGNGVIAVSHKVGVNPRSERELRDVFLLSRDEFASVVSWQYKFTPCPQPRIDFCIDSTACDNDRLYYPSRTD